MGRLAGFDPEIHAFAAATVDLQEKRFIADYDVMARVNRSTALLSIATDPAAGLGGTSNSG